MRWFLVDKSKTAQPADGTYHEWKPLLRLEGRNQCVYCAIHERQFGGLRNFHVEHYRPRKHFPELTNDIGNLFYACGICNSFKGGNWPSEPSADHSTAAYPSPALVDYSRILTLGADFRVTSVVPAGRFIVERLYLNRPQLVYLRRFFAVLNRLRELAEEVVRLSEQFEAGHAAMVPLLREQAAAMRLLIESNKLVPYDENDVRR